MQRAVIVTLLALTIVTNSRPALADCAADAGALEHRLSGVADGKRREEARLLLEKARVDAQHGRADVCAATLKRASKLVN